MQRVHICAAVLFASCAAFAQTTPATPSFVVASIKPSAPPETSMGPGGGMLFGIRMGVRGGPGTSDPGQLTYSGMSIKGLIVNAYGVKTYQVSGPDWMDSQRFDIVAKVPPGATKEDVKLMMQNLLAERFKLTLHREKKDLPMYALVIGKNGPKLKETPPDDPNAKAAAPEPAAAEAAARRATQVMGGGGMPPPPTGGGTRMMMQAGRMRLMANKQTMAQLADTLGNQMDRPVVDQTGLTKNYDVTLEYAPEGLGGRGMPGMPMLSGPPGGGGGDGGAPPEADTAPSLFTAVQEQLGLKLEQKKGAVDFIVIDHLEKTPTEN